ncbi:hypothetical protein ACFL1B_00700 [Nanoarchaeota archaeon]
MDEDTAHVTRIMRKMHKELGGAILIEELISRSAERDLPTEVVLEAIEKLKMDGIISTIDEDTIEFL